MFKKSLQDKLIKIFAIEKVSFDKSSKENEQGCLFVEVESCNSSIKDDLEVCRVRGKIKIYTTSDKLPYGFFNKRIQLSDTKHTKDIFFHDLEENSSYYGNLVERTMSFVYFFSGQHNPIVGRIKSIELEYK